jgi:septation ring formation regulator EzrA
MLHELDELMEHESAEAGTGLEAVQARLKESFATLESRVDMAAKALAALPNIKAELQKTREENAQLKAERETLKKSTHDLTQKNQKLESEIKHVSERLDTAIEKIGKLIES